MNQKSDPTAESESVKLEILQPNALQAMEAAHIDMQIATAHRYPRSLEQFQKRAMAMVTMDEETAESCIYRRPVGKEKNAQGQWVEKFAEGNSVRMAEIVAACYGNIRSGSQIIEQTERSVTAQGVAHDLETNNYISVQVVESTVTKDGQPYSERMRTVIAKAVLAKARRDAVFIVVPKALCKKLGDTARKVAVGDALTLESRKEKIQTWLKSISVEDARVFAVLDIKGWADLTLDHIETLTGLKTALKDGDISAADAFPVILKTGQVGGLGQPVSGEQVAAPTDAPSFPEPLKELQRRIASDGITEAQVVAYCKQPAVALCKPTTEQVEQMKESSLINLLTAWRSVLPNIRKIGVKE